MNHREIRLFQNFLTLAGICLLAYAGAMHGYRKAYQAYLKWTFVPEISIKPSSWPPAPLAEGMPVGRLEIPRLNLSVMVLEGVGERTLEKAAGHVPETALPGEAGNVGIAAHRDTFFRALQAIEDNDRIRLTTPAGIFDYAVEWTRIVKPSAVDVLRPTSSPALTLVTCYPFSYVGAAPERFIVRARLLNEDHARSEVDRRREFTG